MAAWILAVAIAGIRVHTSLQLDSAGLDMGPVYGAGQAVLHGHSMYVPGFVYPPSAGLLAAPIAASISFHQLVEAMGILDVLAMAVTVAVGCRLAVRNSWWMALSAFGTILLLKSDLGVEALKLENLSILLAPAGLLVALLACKGRWGSAMTILGVTLVIKPLLLPLLLLPVVARRWKLAIGTAGASAIVAVLSAAVSGELRHAWRVADLVLHGSTLVGNGAVYNISLSGLGSYHHLPSAVVDLLRVAVVVLLLIGLVFIYRHGLQSMSEFVAFAMFLLAAVFLASSLSEDHYLLALLPGVVIVGAKTSSLTVRMLMVATTFMVLYSGFYLHFGADYGAAQARQVIAESAVLLGAGIALRRSLRSRLGDRERGVSVDSSQAIGSLSGTVTI